ncbi:MAG: ExeM/NucH family extracellular endonuclease, partial [Microbacterium sp.]
LEGMLVTLPQSLAILEYFEYGRFGTLELGVDRQYQPTATYLPGTPEAAAEAASNLLERITLDDGMNRQNTDPLRHPNGQPFTLDNSLRGGDLVTNATGVLDWRFGTWAVQPTQAAEFTVDNPRPAVPDAHGDLVVSSFNVLNYFTTLNLPGTGDDDIARGAESQDELARQQVKIIDALAEIDADVFGLIEIENNADVALKTLTDALNARVAPDVYEYIATGKIGTDVIATALIYKPATVEPLGAFQLMNSAADPAWDDELHRPGLTQTFGSVETGEKFTVVVNHLKSKGSACPTGNDPQQGNCNGPRTAAAQALATWLATDPTRQDTVGRELIIGDLNSYDKEDPIRALTTAGYTDLLLKYQGEDAYTYVFDGQLGYLDHGLAGPGLLADITGAAPWNVNSDEPDILDYNTNFKSAGQIQQWFAPDAYRSSDHDPVIVGIDLDTTPPTLKVTADPAKVWPPDNKPRTVTITVEAADDSGEVSVELVETTATGAKKAAVEELSDTSFRVIAAQGSVYTFTYEATDAVGNTTTATATVKVQR